MSTLLVEVVAIEEIVPIQDADKIERIRVKNWWCVSGKGQYKIGDKAVYIPPDSVLKEELADKWGIKKYCPPCPQGFRVKACRFRGVPSFGTIQPIEDQSWEVGKDVKDFYSIEKYEPPVKDTDGDAETESSVFFKYTGIENIGNYPDIFENGEEVICGEKIHGTNSRVGYILDRNDELGSEHWVWAAGSHSVRRKELNAQGKRSLYWMPFAINEFECPLRNMLVKIWLDKKSTHSVIVYGEIFGKGVQDLDYGTNVKSHRVFDISVDGVYLDDNELDFYLELSGIKKVPCLYKGPFSMEKMNEIVDGPTTIASPDEINSKFKGREGIVIKPVKERNHWNVGRVILKHISVDYFSRKNGTENH